MSKREYIFVEFNGLKWRVDYLGKHTYLLIAKKEIAIEQIHQSTFLIKEIFGTELKDIVPAYHSIAIFIEKPIAWAIDQLSNSAEITAQHIPSTDGIEVPICYELGMDLDHISSMSALSKEEVINVHLGGIYQSLFIGFTPGFIYAGGLDTRLECARKTNPRKRVEAGSIGIGGSQTGIYSLASPGGWNIIGRTPLQIFDQNRSKPLLLEAGTSFKFYRITKEKFEKWEN
ncbi:MAG: 5-oxoprolinase subunit PxpB [Ekhidna sp.]